MAAIHIDRYTLVVERICQECGRAYTIGQFAESSKSCFHKPERYIDGCEQYCLACWLGVGPNDDDFQPPQSKSAVPTQIDIAVGPPYNDLGHEPDQSFWPYEEVYERLVLGNLVDSYRWFFDHGWHLTVLPLTRVRIVNPVFFPTGGAIFP